MRILVTGGAGFIGSHLCERLVRDGHDLYVIDDLNTFYDPKLKQRNLATIGAAGTFLFTMGDICDEALVRRVCDDFKPEAVVHLAARAGVRQSIEEPLLYEHVNVRGTAVLLEACRITARKFVFASSSSVYGAGNGFPFHVGDSVESLSPYAATKIAGEQLCQAYARLYRMEMCLLRFFTVYGPRQRPDLAIRKFAQLILDGQPVPFFGDGSTARDYTYVEDIVDGIVAALSAGHGCEIFNLGNSHPVTLRRMIEVLEHALRRRAILNWLPSQPGDRS